MEARVLENYKRYLERVNFCKNFGYDIEQERNFILKESKPIKGNILEIGTGKGYFTIELAKEGYSFTSVDISEKEQEFAMLNLAYLGLEKQVNFKIDNAEDLSFKNESFDVIFAINAIHHFTSPFKAMDEFIRVAKLKGKIILSDFNEEGMKMIGKIHLSEGRKHEAGEVNLSQIDNYLKGKELNTQIHKGGFEDIVIAFR
ncbi:MAG: class I SAM-dependent methyltransferase [Candidatus Omnitrophica bacterium]|nr:class I SAM-dependent methyltransferase [Candidatus Omnitrophota bacterium]MBU1047282.1 class I SAM-dependent methyltransferase [Candidatus Omnitrophota bacterium]MBU1631166.1 class I SAM-dependent methyltransferase [Candidatus Omnitrophota bacterium]MBU1889133.1 class I SAM-dependent methyltransferase [Candidatus Omnitrophota bacterium]